MTKQKSLFEKVTFSSLFHKNPDGSLTPAKTLSIVGVPGNFTEADKITELRLSDHSYIHEYKRKWLSIRKLANTVIIMKFS